MSLFEVSDGELAELARRGAGMALPWPDESLHEVAALALAIGQERTRAAGVLLSSAQARSYGERSEVERAGVRAAVRDAVVALVLAGYIELPE